jgi:protocatechuate 3,4-dioxygenase, alpha subunit
VTATHAPTPGQTVGPFFGYALPYDGSDRLVPLGHPDAIRLHGTVYDGTGAPVPDALIEIWQPDSDGRVVSEPGSLRRDGYTFTGWGRAATDSAGTYSFTTVEPGPTEPGRAAFFAVTVFARGLLDRLFTRVYVPTDTSVLDADPLLMTLDADRRATVVATPDAGGLHVDIRLQGEGETVFLSYDRP